MIDKFNGGKCLTFGIRNFLLFQILRFLPGKQLFTLQKKCILLASIILKCNVQWLCETHRNNDVLGGFFFNTFDLISQGYHFNLHQETEMSSACGMRRE